MGRMGLGRSMQQGRLPWHRTLAHGLRRWAVLGAFLSLAGTALAFDLDDVSRLAAVAASAPYRPAPPADAATAALTYDAYRELRFRPERGLWRGKSSTFEVQFFPLGRSFTRPLRMVEIADGKVIPIVVRRSAFDTKGAWPAQPGDPAVGVAGWRMTHPLNGAEPRDEVIALLGASYFRAIGAGQGYGLSARAVAIDTVGGRAEEFPDFTAFWLERPPAGAKEMTFYALLDGPSVAGAYRFVVRPGATTVVDVQARLYFRRSVAMLGIAPLTSMFLSGENQPVATDYRPEVHDSDGLQIHTAAGEWLWRPLTNPGSTFVTSFATASPRGFGLMQRDRAYASYEDLEARYERRPSAWVEPLGDWGPGRVELLQFHTPDETHDNVVAYWVPERAPQPGVPLDFAWRVHWAGDDAIAPPAARVVQTRRGHGYRRTPTADDHLQFHLDFAGPGLPKPGSASAADAEPVTAVASGNANVRGLRAIAYPNPARGGWRVTLDFERQDAGQPVELRVFLRRGEQTLSETWSYALAPEAAP